MQRIMTHGGRFKIEMLRSLERSLSSTMRTPQLDVYTGNTNRNQGPIETTKGRHILLVACSKSNIICSYFHSSNMRLVDEKDTPPAKEEEYEDECWSDYSGGETDEEDRCLVEAFTSIQEFEIKEEQISLEIAKLQTEKAKIREMQSCVWLRYLFQRYRMAAREVLDPQLTESIEELKDPFGGPFNVKSYSYDFALFLKKLHKNIECNQKFQSMLRRKGINDSGDFYEITKFAYEHDYETWKKYPELFPVYILKDETLLKVTFSAPFDVAGSEHFIQKLDSISTQEKCRKMISYLSKL